VRYAYQVVVTRLEQAEAELNRLGDEGWRLAQVGVGAGDGGEADTLYLFLEYPVNSPGQVRGPRTG